MTFAMVQLIDPGRPPYGLVQFAAIGSGGRAVWEVIGGAQPWNQYAVRTDPARPARPADQAVDRADPAGRARPVDVFFNRRADHRDLHGVDGDAAHRRGVRPA